MIDCKKSIKTHLIMHCDILSALEKRIHYTYNYSF